MFDGTTIIKNLDKELPDKSKIYKKKYESLPLLEPSVRFFTTDTIYKLKKGKEIKLHHNLECRNFYMIHSGKWVFIRFNPDRKGIDIADKLDKLVETIEDAIYRIENEQNTGLLEIVKLYY